MSAQKANPRRAAQRLLRAAANRERQRDLDEFWAKLAPKRLDEAVVVGGGVFTTVLPPLLPEALR